MAVRHPPHRAGLGLALSVVILALLPAAASAATAGFALRMDATTVRYIDTGSVSNDVTISRTATAFVISDTAGTVEAAANFAPDCVQSGATAECPADSDDRL